MKRIITLLVAALPVLPVLAQSETTEEAKRVILGERRNTRTSYPNSGNPKDVVLGNDRRIYDERNNYPYGNNTDAVNRDYDEKIRSIRNNRTLSNAEKDRIIRDLEAQRQRRLREIRGNDRNRGYDDRRYDDRRDERRRYDDDDYKHNKNNKYKQKGNNGKHKGWEKGKGNPHRGRG